MPALSLGNKLLTHFTMEEKDEEEAGGTEAEKKI